MSRTLRMLAGFALVCVGLGVLSAGVNDKPANGGFAAAGVIMMACGVALAFGR